MSVICDVTNEVIWNSPDEYFPLYPDAGRKVYFADGYIVCRFSRFDDSRIAEVCFLKTVIKIKFFCDETEKSFQINKTYQCLEYAFNHWLYFYKQKAANN